MYLFQALGVESEEDIEMLSRYFVKFQVMEPAQLHDVRLLLFVRCHTL